MSTVRVNVGIQTIVYIFKARCSFLDYILELRQDSSVKFSISETNTLHSRLSFFLIAVVLLFITLICQKQPKLLCLVLITFVYYFTFN